MFRKLYLRKYNRWWLISSVFVIWVYFSMHEKLIHEGLDILSLKTISFFKINQNTFPSEYNLSRLKTFSYNILYCGFCLLFIHLYFKNWRISKLALILYFLMFIFTVSINELGKILPFEPFRVTAYRIMTVMVSPLPIVLLIPAIHLTKMDKE